MRCRHTLFKFQITHTITFIFDSAMNKRGAGKTTKAHNAETKNETGSGTFTFKNGDTYDGEYKFNCDRCILVKEGTGTYTTDNFDIYHAVWEDDSFADTDVHIRYNNDAQFRGRIEANGTMNGPGTYTFPDGSSIDAIWVDNVPSMNIIYREPRGFPWMVKEVSQDTISFFTGNHFWDNMLSNQRTTQSIESFEQE